jgi:2-oxoisovalerate dehydrogenase E1 component
MKGGLPLIFNIMNNQYAMGGQTRGETMGYEMAARLGAGINPDQMYAERIDGYQPLAVIDAIRPKREVIEQRRGPVLLDTLTYRYAGHSPSDADSYRTEEEKAAWEAEDSISSFRQQLLDAAVAKPEDFAPSTSRSLKPLNGRPDGRLMLTCHRG